MREFYLDTKTLRENAQDLKAGDNFMFYTGKPIHKNFYTKTDITLPDDETTYWAINIVTGERERFMKNDFVIPVDTELKVKRHKTEPTCEGCKHFNIATYDTEPCISCKRYYVGCDDKYEKEREEGQDEQIT